MRLTHYLTEGRTQTITPDKAANLLKTKCKQAVDGYKQGHYMSRGFANDAEFGFVQPSKFTRKSAYVGSNYYTLIMSHHKSWWQYPPREKSIVCSVGLPKSTYGNPFVVFPFDNSKVGVCKSFDLWFSFDGTFNHTLDMVSDWIRSAIAVIGNKSLSDVDWDTLQKDLKLTADVLENHPEKAEHLRGEFRENWPHDVRFDDWVYSLFDPKKNKFKLTRPGDFTANDEKVRKECWTDGDSVLVGLTKYYKLQIVDDLIDSIA